MTTRPPGAFKHSSNFTGSETAANPNPNNAASITMTAQWRANCTENCSDVDLNVNESIGYGYTGAVKGVTLKKAGYYKLEVWGAQGGQGYQLCNYDYVDTAKRSVGGLGGYSYGKISVTAESVYYVVVGGAGNLNSRICSSRTITGGYNGGGDGGYSDTSNSGGSGGGASHIATTSGVLSSLLSSANRAKVLIVAGGGGGGGNSPANSKYYGGNGGGYEGGSGGANYTAVTGKQSTGYVFGRGENGSSWSGSGGSPAWNCGGGGGWYGGGSGGYQSGGGGSGYIGNTLLLSDKGMYQYSSGASDCKSSTVTATKTTCTSSTGAHVANAANTGNGYARITYLGT